MGIERNLNFKVMPNAKYFSLDEPGISIVVRRLVSLNAQMQNY